MTPPPFRVAGEAVRHECKDGGNPQSAGHVPGNQEADLPPVLLPVQRRNPGDPGTVAERRRLAASPEEMLRQHQAAGAGQGRSFHSFKENILFCFFSSLNSQMFFLCQKLC